MPLPSELTTPPVTKMYLQSTFRSDPVTYYSPGARLDSCSVGAAAALLSPLLREAGSRAHGDGAATD